MISVLMSVYKKEKAEYLEAALESILNQTLMPDEIVLIKDGPLTEELEDVIAKAGERYPALLTFQFEENVQLGRALAKGVELCKGDCIARMDTDDIAVSHRLEWQSNYLALHPEIAACGGWMEEFDDAKLYQSIKKMPEGHKDIIRYARYRNPLNHMTVMFRKKDVMECGNYRHFPFLEDYELWIRMLGQGKKLHNIQKVLVQARTNENVYGRRGGWGYFKRYKELRIRQKKLGLVSGSECVKGIMLSFAMTVQPAQMRKVIYRRILRRSRNS